MSTMLRQLRFWPKYSLIDQKHSFTLTQFQTAGLVESLDPQFSKDTFCGSLSTHFALALIVNLFLLPVNVLEFVFIANFKQSW